MTAQISELVTSSASAPQSSKAPRTHEADDQALIASIAAGDSNALEQLYDRYGSVVYRVALRMLKNRELPAAQRQAIALAYFGGMSHQEIATKLNRPLGTIKTRVRLGLHKLGGLLVARGLQASDAW